jgi:hypothetical protein
MTATNELSITNNTSGKQFIFRCVAPLEHKKEQPAINVALMNTGSSDAFLFRFSGQQRDLTWTFAIFDDNVDVSNATNSPAIKTVAAQIQYLMDTIFSKNWNTYWTLTDLTGTNLSTTISGIIESITIHNPVGSGSIRTGDIVFKEGRIGAI